MEQLSLEIKNALLKEGASLIGFADIRCIPPKARQSMDYAISIGVALDPAIIKQVGLNGPTREYSNEKLRVNCLLNHLSEFAAKLLKDKGYNAVSMLADNLKALDKQTISTPFQHKTVATRAGLGWIGKSALLVTEEFGPALRINSVLTNAVLECGTPVDASKCSECKECVNACPAKAISGNLWDISKSRDDAIKGRDYLINAINCVQYIFKYNEKLGVEAPDGKVCGICIAACPRTKRYITWS